MADIFRDYWAGDESVAQALLVEGLKPYGLEADFSRTDADIVDIKKSYLDNGGIFRFLQSEGEVAGMYGLYKLSDASCELRKMYLHPACKGKGFGRLLMLDAFERAKSAGFREMLLETNSRLVEALAMYRKYGFVEYAPEHLSARCNLGMRRTLEDGGPS